MELASYVKNDRRYRITSRYVRGPYRLSDLRVVDDQGQVYEINDNNGQYRIMDRKNGKSVNTTVPKAIIAMLLNK